MKITDNMIMWVQIKNIVVVLCATFLAWQVSLWGLLLLLALSFFTTNDNDKDDDESKKDSKILLNEHDRD